MVFSGRRSPRVRRARTLQEVEHDRVRSGAPLRGVWRRRRLVQFGDAGGYRYHCLTCWQEVAERVVVAYVEAPETAPREGGPVPDA